VSDGDRDWQYRMSLYYVKPEDANTFTCQTPRRQTNSVKIVVTVKNVFESLSFGCWSFVLLSLQLIQLNVVEVYKLAMF
jgi:hypothetical protein